MLCLNMIVKNECARILRALEAAKPYISTFAILDTGSTDGTDELIKEWAEKNSVNGIIGHGVFVDFSQARNQALDLARTWRNNPGNPAQFDYILLQDADMELAVPPELGDAPFTDLTGEMYEMVQKGGAVAYHNPRLLAAWSKATYVGVTHEYLNVAPAGTIAGAHFVDHADGANRADKYERDVRLLETDLERDPNNPRTWFYLGNSYRDGNEPAKALVAYQRRLELGGWDEENFITQCNIAACHKDLGDEAEFFAACLKAYEMRPTRSESLYDLAYYLREKGRNDLAMLFIEKGVIIPRPNDKLFVNEFVYSAGFRDEYSICGFYNESTREKAFHITNGLALDPSVPDYTRHRARSNMVFYLKPLVELAPSTRCGFIEVSPRDGYVAMNPSICARPNGGLEAIVRTVNYRIDAEGRYMIGEQGCWDAPIMTENLLVQLGDDLSVRSSTPVLWDRPPAKFDKVIGLEDMRLFWHHGDRCFSACVREQSDRGECEQWVGRLSGLGVVTATERISDGSQTEKNWAPWPRGARLDFVYRMDTIWRPAEKDFEKIPRPFACDNISGSSQWVPFLAGYISVVHEAITHPTHGKRVYQHRFAYITQAASLARLSVPFVFNDVQIEFCAGLAAHPDERNFILSYGVRDCEAWLATASMSDVAAMLGF